MKTTNACNTQVIPLAYFNDDPYDWLPIAASVFGLDEFEPNNFWCPEKSTVDDTSATSVL